MAAEEKKLQTKLRQLGLAVERPEQILQSGKSESIKRASKRYETLYVRLTLVNGLSNLKNWLKTRTLNV